MALWLFFSHRRSGNNSLGFPITANNDLSFPVKTLSLIIVLLGLAAPSMALCSKHKHTPGESNISAPQLFHLEKVQSLQDGKETTELKVRERAWVRETAKGRGGELYVEAIYNFFMVLSRLVQHAIDSALRSGSGRRRPPSSDIFSFSPGPPHSC